MSNGESSRDVDVYRTCALRGIIQRRGLLHRFECAGDREPGPGVVGQGQRGPAQGPADERRARLIVDPSTLGEQTWVCAVVRSRELRKDKSLVIDLEVDGALTFGRSYSLVECTATYFEAYRWVLNCLQAADLEAFAQNRVLQTFLRLPEEPPPPDYVFPRTNMCLGRRSDVFWMRMPGLVMAGVPSTRRRRVVKRALMKSVAVIQGLPGAGKTHVGLEVMRLLLANVCGVKAKNPFGSCAQLIMP